MAKISVNKFKAALPKSGGVRAVIAKTLGVDRSAVTLYLQRHPELLPLLEEQSDVIDDMAEYRLFEKIVAGDLNAIKFRLSTKGKNRGYVTKEEEDFQGMDDVKIVFELPSDMKEVIDVTPKEVDDGNKVEADNKAVCSLEAPEGS